jgi:membrane protein involved in colicin uptake
MKLTTGILAVAMMTGAAWGQNPDAIDNARSVAKSLQQIKTNQTNEALAAGSPAPQADKLVAGSPAKPATGQPAAAKAAGVKPAAVPAAKGKAAPATKTAKPHDAFAPKQKAVAAAKGADRKSAAKPAATSTVAASEKPADAGKSDAAKAPKPEDKKWAMTGKRDPFFSPVLQQTTTSGCSTGKKCLEIGQINVRGVVKSESGFIAVVTNSLNKAYFLHENDPVFNGYVMRITGDSVVFQESFQDKLGKPLTREVVKKILTPAV